MKEKETAIKNKSHYQNPTGPLLQTFDCIAGLYIAVCILWHELMVIVPFIHLVTPTPLTSLSSWLWYAGILMMAVDLLLFRKIRRVPGSLLLYALLAAALFSSFLQREYGIKSNLQTIVWMLILYSLFYTAAFRIRRAQLHSLLNILFILSNLIWSGACILSLYQFAFLIGAAGPRYAPSPIFNSTGFYKNRLFGLFGYPEYGAVIGLVIILASGYYFVRSRRWFVKVLIILLELPIFWYIVLSGSRNAALAMYFSVFVCALLAFRGNLPDKTAGTQGKRLLISFLLAALVLCGVHAAYISVRRIAPYIPPLFEESREKKTSSSGSDMDGSLNLSDVRLYTACVVFPARSVIEDSMNLLPCAISGRSSTPVEHSSDITIKKRDQPGFSDIPVRKIMAAADKPNEEILKREDSAEDISTGRFEIWRDYLSLTKEIGIFGLSPENSSFYIQEHHPDLYIAQYIEKNYPKRYKAGYVFHPHNGYLKVFVSTGFLGLAILLTFMALCLQRIFSYLKTNQKVSPEFLFSLLMVLSGASSAMFDLEIFFVIKPMTFIFWLSLGLLMKSCGSRRPDPRISESGDSRHESAE